MEKKMAKVKTNLILKEMAEEILESSLSPLMEGMEKLATADIIGETLHITECDTVDYKDAHYCVIKFDEYPNHFYSGGLVLTKLIDGLINVYAGDLSQLNNELKNDGLAIMLDTEKTKDRKRTVTTVKIL